MIKTVLKQMINTRQWTTKYVTGFCATGSRIAYNKQWPTADCLRYSHPQETSHILQCPHPETQSLWDSALLQLREQLLQLDTDTGITKDLSAGLDTWRKQALPPPAITNIGWAQTELTWDNLVYGFLLLALKSQQAEYYISKQNLLSPAHWAADLLHGIFKISCQQWD